MASGRPMRIVSLDFCADQYVLDLVDRGRIAAVSPDADAPFSYKRRAAVGVPQVSSRIEEVLALGPDLVVRTYGGGPEAARVLARAGVPVLQIGYADDLRAVRRTLVEAAEGLGASARGQALAAQMDARLAAAGNATGVRTVLYATSGGATTGPGTLIHDLMTAAGLANFERAPGWRPLPLERLAYERPDVIAAAAFGGGGGALDAWSAGRHPVLLRAMAETPTVPIDGAWTACGGWFVLDAVEAIARAPAPPAGR